jgi:hypothetical protein
MKKRNIFFALLIFLFSTITISAQDDIDRWDNWLLIGNKIVFGGQENWTHSHELQWRVKDNMQSLDQWYYEGVATYSFNEKWSIVPDLRIAIKPNKVDYRLGFGAVKVGYFKKEGDAFRSQLVNQIKYQFDFDSEGNTMHGLRWVVTYNKIVNEKFIVSALVGPFYRWSENFSGIEFVRGGPVFTYVFDSSHTLAFASLFGGARLPADLGWTYSFTPMIQLIIRINKNYKYTPAKYINY